jgi:outer membrane protein OmpA-like peptidoglycan-associated protein
MSLAVLILVLAWPPLRGDGGDVESSHDYPGWTRFPGFVITDYDEDNPASFDFPVARPQPTDAAHLETVHAVGHRYVIRYEPGPNLTPPTLWQVQDYYEKLAAAAHFVVEKNGAVGDVNETFHRPKPDHDLWIYLEPGMSAIVLTVLETTGPTPAPPVAPPAPAEDPFYLQLIKNGRVTLPITFLPSRPDLEPGARPALDRVAGLLQKHPELKVILEGHTDNTGDPDENLRLSEERARATRALLIADGVAESRLTAVGFGGEHPLAGNNTAEGREQNRRIELVLNSR